MKIEEWIALGCQSGAITPQAAETVSFQEAYKQWFRMKQNVIRAQSCDRIEVTYHRYYAGSWIEDCSVAVLDERKIIRFLTEALVRRGKLTTKEFRKLYQIVNNVMIYAKDLDLGGAKLLDWERIRRYLPEGKIVPPLHPDFAIPKADVEKLLQMVLLENVYPLKRSASLCLALNFFLGLRVGELASLTWRDVDLDRRVVRISKTETKFYGRDKEGNRSGPMVYRVVEHTKTICSVREIPLLPEAVHILQLLRAHHGQCRYEDQPLAYDGTTTILVRSLDRTLRRLCQSCGIPCFNTHRIRKTFATMLHASGMPTRYISDLLGHSEMLTTERSYLLTYKDNYGILLEYMRQGLDFKQPETSKEFL